MDAAKQKVQAWVEKHRQAVLYDDESSSLLDVVSGKSVPIAWRDVKAIEEKINPETNDVYLVLLFENHRQIALVESGGSVTQQTMLYDAKENGVRPQRSKEESHDYRYFPEPDLPPLVLSPEFVAEQQGELPELPAQKRERFVASYGLSREHATVVASTRAVADYFETVAKTSAEPQAAANWVMTEALADAKDHDDQLRVSPAALSQIIGLVKGGTLSNQAAKRVFAEVAAKSGDPRSVAESLGLIQVADANALALPV